MIPNPDNLIVSQNIYQPIPETTENKKNWVSTKIGKLIATSVIALELNPISNEVARGALLAGTLAATHDPVLAAAAFGGSTLVLEGAGGIVAADVLDTEGSKEFIEKTNHKLEKIGIKSLPKMNKPVEAAVAQLAGAPALTFLKHRENPERTRKQNRRYATIASLGISAVCSAQGLAVAEGFHSPSPEMIGLAALGAGSFLASLKWARKRINNHNSPSDPEKAPTPIHAEKYREVVDKYTIGPQVEGLTEEEMKIAEQDTETTYIYLNGEKEVPMLANIKYAAWLNPDFFSKRGYSTRDLRYCLLPQELLKGINRQQLVGIIKKAARGGDISVLIDYPETATPFYYEFPLEHRVDLLTTENGTPAATYHFHSKLRAKREELEMFPADPAIRDINPALVDAQADIIWDIYNSRFQVLVDDHPIAGAMPKEELLATLKSEDCIGAAYFDEKGVLQSFGYAVTDLDLCPWLNKTYFKKEAEGLPSVYMPGIASSPDALIASSTKIMTHLLKKQFKNTPEFVLNFECSNKSAEYIPRLVRRAFDRSGFVDDNGLHELKHLYRIVSFPAESEVNISLETPPALT